jgi:predicted permease
VFTIPEHPSQAPSADNSALYRSADPEYFKALRIPLQSGRFFRDNERLERTRYVIISRKFADQFFPNESPLGRHVSLSWTNKPEPYEIIGVVGDTLHDLGEPVRATIYFPIFSGIPDRTSGATIVIHTAREPLALSVPVQKQIAALDPSLPVYDVFTMQQIIERATASQSFSATLALAFAALSLLLAAIGLYGVLSYLVSQRVTEIGIRLALGAQRGAVLRLVLLDGMRPVLIGLLIGSGGAIAAGLLIRSVLYQTQPVDPVVFAITVGILLLSAVVAGVVPGLRACRIEPTQALRAE